MRHFLICLSLLCLLCACSERRISWAADSAAVAKSGTYTGAEADIAAMEQTEWSSPQQYTGLRRSIEQARSLSETDRAALLRRLERAYADQLTRTMSAILSGPCAPRHAALHAAHAEYARRAAQFEGYRPAAHAAVEKAYALHQRQAGFGVSTTCRVSSAHDVYDASYDARRRSEAAAIRAQHPTCTAIRAATDAANVNTRLARRRADFNAKIQALRSRSND